MTKPTGRPRGRPKTKEYITLMARVPQDLAERVQRYAGRKRQTVSDVLRDGLLVLLEEEDPYRSFTSDRNTEASLLSDTKEDNREEQPSLVSDKNIQKTSIVSDLKAERAKGGATKTAILSYIKEEKSAIESDKKAAPAKASDRKKVMPTIVSYTNRETSIVSDTIPDFDPAKYVLGKLCPRAHEYHGTGQTLLKRSNRHCMACDREKFHERKQAKRAK